jgi:hypothetical protein
MNQQVRQFIQERNRFYRRFLEGQKSKFIFSILRREIPEPYNIDIELPENKHKCYMELTDGSVQI